MQGAVMAILRLLYELCIFVSMADSCVRKLVHT